jgi:hypothetical protein
MVVGRVGEEGDGWVGVGGNGGSHEGTVPSHN